MALFQDPRSWRGRGGGVSIWSTAQLVRSHSQSLGYLGLGEPLGGVSITGSSSSACPRASGSCILCSGCLKTDPLCWAHRSHCPPAQGPRLL